MVAGEEGRRGAHREVFTICSSAHLLRRRGLPTPRRCRGRCCELPHPQPHFSADAPPTQQGTPAPPPPPTAAPSPSPSILLCRRCSVGFGGEEGMERGERRTREQKYCQGWILVRAAREPEAGAWDRKHRRQVEAAPYNARRADGKPSEHEPGPSSREATAPGSFFAKLSSCRRHTDPRCTCP